MSKPTLGLARPSASPAPRPMSAAAAKLEAGEARLVVNLPQSLHRQIKIRAVERGVTIREYVLQLLAADGIS